MQESGQPDFFTVIYNWTLETAPITITSDNATIQDYDEFIEGSGVQLNCTELSGLDLMEVIARADIGNTELWGSMSKAWLACFIVYYALFSILLVITVCSYAYFLRQLRSRLRTVLILFGLWSFFSFVHHVLLMNSVVNGSSVQLANATRDLEIIASSSFINFAIVIILSSDPKSHSSQLQRYIMFLIIPAIYLIAGANIVVSFFAGRSVLFASFVLRLLLLLAYLLSVNLDINYIQCFKSKEWLHLLWTQKLKKVSFYPYFFISCAYFLYVLITIANSDCCIEQIELHRAVWLVCNCLLKTYEFGFSMVYLVKIRKMFQSSLTASEENGCSVNWIKSLFRQERKPPLKSSSFTYEPSSSLAKGSIHRNFSLTTQLTDLKTEENTLNNHSYESHAVMKEQTVQTASCSNPMMNLENGVIEIESLHQNHNLHYADNTSAIDVHNVDLLSDSVVTCSMSADITHYVKSISYSDTSLNIATESPIINEGKVIELYTDIPVYSYMCI